jgi:hypothetical protein
MFQKLLDNMAVKMKQLWVCGFSNFVVSVTSLDILRFLCKALKNDIVCLHTFLC